jgi:hypothetical protein
MTSDKGRRTVSYLVRCALPVGRSIVKQDQNGTSYTYGGSIGLAPQWETSACDTHCQEAVTACLMAHVNTAGIHIPLWLDSPATAVGWGRDAGYPNQEGTYFGNIFTPNAGSGKVDAFYCNGSGWAKSVVPGRLGAYQPNAPYSNPFGTDAMCAGHCTAAASPNQGDGFQSCMSYRTPITVWRKDSQAFDEKMPYRICSKLSGKCLDVVVAGQANGARVQQWDFGGGANQKWLIKTIGDGYYRVCAQHSGKCLNVNNGSTANGADINQWTDYGEDHQRFAIEPMGGGLFSIVAKHDSRAVEVANKSTANGERIQQWDYWGGPNQLWSIAPAP